MGSMITKCPGCGRNGIMSKATGKCFHCNKAAGLTKPAKARGRRKVDVKQTATEVIVTETITPPPKHASPPPMLARAPKPRPTTRMPRIVGGRVVR